MPENPNNQVNHEETSEKEVQRLGFKDFIKVTRWAFSLFYRFRPKFTVILILTIIISGMSGLVNSYIMGRVIDTIISTLQTPNPSLLPLYPYLGIIIGYSLFNTIVGFFRNYTRNVIRVNTRPQLIEAYYKKLHQLGIQTLEQPSVNDKMNRADNYLWNVLPYMISVVEFIGSIAEAIASLVIIAAIVPVIVPFIALSMVPYLLQDRKYRGLLWRFMYVNTERNRRAQASANDLSSSVDLQEISIAGAFKFLSNKYWEFQNEYIAEWIKIIKRWFVGGRVLRTLSDFVVYGGYIKVLSNAVNGLISVGQVTFQLRILNNFQGSLMNVISQFNDLTETSLQIRDVYTLFNMTPIFSDGKVVLEKMKAGPEIRFMNVSFTYPNAESPVIENLNLKIRSGEKVAIVGHNGAGKTTLIKLISRIYRTTEGEILVNGTNLNDIKIESLYKNMGALFQDFNKYPQLTVKENIYIGKSEEPIDEIAIRLAAQQADAMSFIDEYPQKFDQVLSEKYKGGIRPSTGQWQKLAIARFFYRNAPLVVFDEPTAAIDPVSEFNIFNKIYEFFENKTVIIVSHKFSTVRNADRILVMDKGKVIEDGTHTELMSLNGKYAQAFMLQAKGYESQTPEP